MKNMKMKVFCLLLAVLLCLTACSANGTGEATETGGENMAHYDIILDENGIANWEPVEGAVKYKYAFVDATNSTDGELFTTETSMQVPEGYCIHVCPVFEDGEFGDWQVSNYSGSVTVISPEELEKRVDSSFDVKWDDLQTYDVISHIDTGSIERRSDGSVYFEADINGGTMRFIGTDVTVNEGSIAFAPGGTITALDAIGRICAIQPWVSDPGSENNCIRASGAYTFSDAVSVESLDSLYFIWGFGNTAAELTGNDPEKLPCMIYQPNFIRFGAADLNEDSFTLSELTIYYDETTFNTGIRLVALDMDQYGTYLEGEKYDSAREVYSLSEHIYDFSLQVVPDVADELAVYAPDILNDMISHRSLVSIDGSKFTIGNLKDADGKVLNKENAQLAEGCTVEVTLGKYTMDVQLPVLERYAGVQTLHELTPYNNASAQGKVTALVIPVYWQDQPENATDELLNKLYADLGRVMDSNGAVTDYSDALTDHYSLSEYYDIASYGKHSITSFVTDWYAAPYNFIGEMEDQDASNGVLMDELYSWLMETYPDMDWSRFDADGDGFFDSVIIVNAGVEEDDETMMATYSYAAMISTGYTGEGAGTQEMPTFKNHIQMNASFLGGSTLIHEYAHGFGLVDYYDVTYSGIDAVGGYDMQSGSYGDWNAYSKYAVGWIEPDVVTGLASGESVELTIGSLAESGDAIVIPAAGSDFDGPFSEYILLDLLTDEGVNTYDAAAFGLDGVAGVRISHVNSNMEKRTLTGSDGVDYPIGTIHIGNNYKANGRYLLEVIQAGGMNTFTDKDVECTNLCADDLFRVGDVFTAEDYSEFLTDGKMDDGSDFDYTIQIVSVGKNASGAYSATIKITRN